MNLLMSAYKREISLQACVTEENDANGVHSPTVYKPDLYWKSTIDAHVIVHSSPCPHSQF